MLDIMVYKKVFSDSRMQKYLDYHENDSKAIAHYNANIKVSQSFYPLLSIFEIALRNSMNRELITSFGNDWYLKLNHLPGLKNLNAKVIVAQRQIIKRNEIINSDKIVAELTFGFWTELLNSEYEQVLWKHLRRAFPYLEKANRKRKNVSSPINQIRVFRNRVYHNEPISWSESFLKDIHQIILETISWLNRDIPSLIPEFDTFMDTIEATKITFKK